MPNPTDALRGAQHSAAPAAARPRENALVAGGGGALGSAVLEQVLAQGCYSRVSALVHAPLRSALRGLHTVGREALDQAGAGTAFVVFERPRHANGRDEAFVRPQVEELAMLAAQLHAAGVRRLLVLLPHAPAMLPQALKAGLATLDEAAVSALGFEHVVFARAAAFGGEAGAAASLGQRFVRWWLSQLRWMVPQREQPVRLARLAEIVVRLAARLPGSPAGTRVLPPEVIWEAAQPGALDAVLDAWLQRPQPAGPAPDQIKVRPVDGAG